MGPSGIYSLVFYQKIAVRGKLLLLGKSISIYLKSRLSSLWRTMAELKYLEEKLKVSRELITGDKESLRSKPKIWQGLRNSHPRNTLTGNEIP